LSRSATPYDSVDLHEVGGFSVRVSNEPDDPDWDDFVEQAPGSAYTQTSSWGRVRSTLGWRPVRVVVSENGRVAAGVQMLVRRLPVGGSIGFVSRGPLVSEDRPDLVGLVFDEVMATGRVSNVQYLVVHAPRGCDWMGHELMLRGLRPNVYEFDHTATICVDLRPDPDDILARMGRTTRRHLRAPNEVGVVVRRGSEADLPIFNRIKDAHAARLGYNRAAEGYYAQLWRALAPRGHVELFIAEYEGEPVSALLAIPFGDTSYHLEGPWSGKHPELRSNELLEWHAYKWAKAEGYRMADLVSVDRAVAESMLAGEGRPPQVRSADTFKLAFGGDPVLLPQGYDYFYNPVLRFAYRSIPRKVLASVSIKRLLHRFRTSAVGRRAS
jgi:lipid II:glycine glycyltransferase (peptidoglycan interpeptide bridge formation enzyme)